MLLSKQSHPDTGETIYRYENSPADAPASPSSLGGHVDPIQALVVRADRVEISWSWCHSSGHAELYVDGEVEVVARGSDGWPGTLFLTIAQRFGAEASAEVERVLNDASAFDAKSAATLPK